MDMLWYYCDTEDHVSKYVGKHVGVLDMDTHSYKQPMQHVTKNACGFSQSVFGLNIVKVMQSHFYIVLTSTVLDEYQVI